MPSTTPNSAAARTPARTRTKSSRRDPAAAAAAWGIDPANPQADLEAARAAAAAQQSPETQVRNYTVAEVAKLLSCHPNTVRDLIATKKLPHFKIGTDYRVRHVDLMAFTQPTT